MKEKIMTIVAVGSFIVAFILGPILAESKIFMGALNGANVVLGTIAIVGMGIWIVFCIIMLILMTVGGASGGKSTPNYLRRY